MGNGQEAMSFLPFFVFLQVFTQNLLLPPLTARRMPHAVLL
jgi:hypothetical protein